MTTLRTDIERALDNLISNESGMPFQDLAVVLAKKRWPDLIACDRKKDLGADAIATSAFAAEGGGKVFACSTTATIKKIRADAKKVKDHFEGIEKLIFATPSLVSNQRTVPWAKRIKAEFELDLAVMSRQDIITSLMEPTNSALLKNHLGINIKVETEVADLVKETRAAAQEVIDSWSQRLAGKPLIELRAVKLNQNGGESPEVLGINEIRASLLHGRRIVLEGPAGRGKTTTLIQLAGKQSESAAISFLVDLNAWVSTRSRILQFIAGMPHFLRRSLDERTLAQVNAAEQFSFLLNGWNEIAETDFSYSETAIQVLERDFPAAGIIIASRTHHLVPPLPGATCARLLTLTRAERTSYLKSRLGMTSHELRLKLENDVVLDELTRTPFFLSEVASLFEAAVEIPKTKVGVLEAVVRFVEQSPEHRNHLERPPVASRATDYLGELATRMTAQNIASIVETEARPIIAAASGQLLSNGQITNLPEPGIVLATLCAHHVLERLNYPEAAFRFQHQQFQEFYTVNGLREQLYALAATPSGPLVSKFIQAFINEPSWAEPLRLLADEIRGRSEDGNDSVAVKAGELLVTASLRVDPVFSAELARLCGAKIWDRVASSVGGRLRSLYNYPGEIYRNYALAAMLASGSEDFRDLIEPILSSDDQQSILGIYRKWEHFFVSSLGPRWRDIVAAGKEMPRVTFVSEILNNRNAPEVVEFASTDPSIEVKDAAIQGLTWLRADDDAARFLTSVDDADFEALIRKLDPDFIPLDLYPRAILVLQNQRKNQTDALERLRTSLKLTELKAQNAVDLLKEDLGNIFTINNSQHSIKSALDIVRENDEVWVSSWIAERSASGALLREHWDKSITSVPESVKQELLHRLETVNLGHTSFGQIINVLAAGADISMAERVFSKLYGLRETITNESQLRHEFEHAIERQLQVLMRAFPADISVRGLAKNFSKPVNEIELRVITSVFSNAGRQEPSPLDELAGAILANLRAYVRDAVTFVIQLNDLSGELNANLASVLASVGEPEDVTRMRQLIEADVKRLRAARALGTRGNSMGYSRWNIQSLVTLDLIDSDAILLDLLNEPEYEQEVASEFVRRVLGSTEAWSDKSDYFQIWDARIGHRREKNEEARIRYAGALKARILALLEERSAANQKRPIEFRLRTLGVALSKIDGNGCSDLIFAVMSFADEWHNSPRIEAFQALRVLSASLRKSQKFKRGIPVTASNASRRWPRRLLGRHQQRPVGTGARRTFVLAKKSALACRGSSPVRRPWIGRRPLLLF